MKQLQSIQNNGINFEVNSLKILRKKEELPTHFLRQIQVLALKLFSNLQSTLYEQIIPHLLPAILGQASILKSASSSSSLSGKSTPPTPQSYKPTPQEITKTLAAFLEDLGRSFIYPSIASQFIIRLYKSINVTLFNALLQRYVLLFNLYPATAS